ncbi:MAG: hypothetical protein CFE21_06490 [Bacteroidetes bacterium B1(2017)]|nr:MAG: hypothetical protein CFE21_06490 [Bacteroidetes bacterium B1(2017)]
MHLCKHKISIMIQDSVDLIERKKKFLSQIVESEMVWGLKGENGFATSNSSELEDEDGEPIGVVCFWGNPVLAEVCQTEDWESYLPTSIPLSDFIENWCVGMSNDGLLVGLNFDDAMIGFEFDPLDLILEIADEIQIQKKEIALQQFESLNALVQEIKKIL